MIESSILRTRRKPPVTAARILDAIRELSLHHRQPPTIRELCAYLGTRSTGHMHYHLLRLETAGFLRPRHHRARSLRLVTAATYPPPPTPAPGFSVSGAHGIEPVLGETPFVEIRQGDLLYTSPASTPAPGFAFGTLTPRGDRTLLRILAIDGATITISDGTHQYVLPSSDVSLDSTVRGVYRALSA
jgi:LexA DNA binding domain